MFCFELNTKTSLKVHRFPNFFEIDQYLHKVQILLRDQMKSKQSSNVITVSKRIAHYCKFLLQKYTTYLKN